MPARPGPLSHPPASLKAGSAEVFNGENTPPGGSRERSPGGEMAGSIPAG